MSGPGAGRGFTGWHATFVLVGFYVIVMAVNFLMAGYASSTFGGIVVENSYVASQHFNRWLDEAKASEKLGWTASAARRPDGAVAVTLHGAPAEVALVGMARHPLGRLPDRPLTFASDGGGRFHSREALPAGRWVLRLEARAGADLWRKEEALR